MILGPLHHSPVWQMGRSLINAHSQGLSVMYKSDLICALGGGRSML
jgi:hypothetical protein